MENSTVWPEAILAADDCRRNLAPSRFLQPGLARAVAATHRAW